MSTVYFYIMYAFSRFGRRQADPADWYPRWRGMVMMLVLQCWVVGIAAAWLRIATDIDFLTAPRWGYLAVGAVLTLANSVLTHSRFEAFKARFDRLPDDRKVRCDVGVTLFVLCVFALTMYSAVMARK